MADLNIQDQAGGAAESRLEHLNRVLRAIRNVNQLITREKDRDRLLEDACRCLTETRGYFNVWIGLWNDAGDFEGAWESGLGSTFEMLLERLRNGEMTACAKEALSRDGMLLKTDPASECKDCPLAPLYEGRSSFIRRLEHEGRVFGLISASVPRTLVGDEDEQDLFDELAGDIAFALYAMEERQQREALEQSLAMANVVVENSPAVLFRWRATKGWPVEYVSENVRRFGYLPEDLRSGRVPYVSIIHPDDLQRVADEVRAASTGSSGHLTQEYRIVSPEGQIFWVDDRTHLVRDEKGRVRYYQGIVMDITARKEAETELRRREEILRETGRTAKVGGWELDVETGKQVWSEEVYRIHEVDMDFEPTGQKGVSFYAPEAQPVISQAVRNTIEHGTSFDLELPFITATGNRRWVHALGHAVQENGQTVKVRGTFQNITDRKEVEEALRDSEELYRALFDSTEDALFLHEIGEDGLPSTFLEVNDAACQRLGYSREELLDMSPHDIDAKRPQQQTRELMMQLVERKRIRFEQEHITKDGRRIPVEIITRLFQLAGRTVCLSSARDITDRIEAERLLRESEQFKTLILESTSELFCFYDENLTIQWANRAAAESTHSDMDEVVGQTCYKLWHGLESPCPDCPVLRARDTLQPQEAQIATPDGRIWWLRSYPLLDADGTLMGLAEFGQDITERHEAEQELRQREERYRTLVRAAPTGTGLVEDRVFLEVNDRLCDLTGYSREELLGQQSAMLYPSKAENDYVGKVFYGQLADSGYAEMETRFQRKDGQVIEILLTGAAVDREHPRSQVTFTIMDITNRKQAERALREREERYRALAANFPHGMLVLFDREFRIIAADGKGLIPLGLSREQMIGRNLHDVVDPDIASITERHCRDVLEGKHVYYELEWSGRIWANRAVPIFAVDGKIHELLVIAQDITEQKRAQEALRDSELRFRNLFENMTCGVAVFEVQDDGTRFVFRDINSAGEKISHKAREELLGREIREVFPTAEEFGMVESLRRAWETGQPQFLPLAEYRDSRLQQWVENRIYKLPSGEIVAVYDDRSEQRRLEEQLFQAQKMDAIGQLAGGVAHDFNNQLTPILGYSDLLLRDEDDPELIQCVEAIRSAARHAADLTGQLLAFSRKGQYQQVPVDLHDTIAEVLTILRHSVDPRIEIITHLGAPHPVILGDPTQLQNAVLNLALNARDAMASGGELYFHTEQLDLGAEFCQSCPGEITPGVYLKLAVTDSGVGMDRETQGRVFEPFFTTKKNGTGMGLSAVYGTIKNHNGTVHLYSEPGHGTTVSMYLPLWIQEEPLAEEASPEDAPVTGDARVLVVEDLQPVRDLVASMLRRLGYRVTTCRNGREALEYYQDAWQHVDLVVLDMIMPEMNGRDTFRAMQKLNPEIRALLISGYSINGEAQSILDEGVRGFLQKPFEIGELSHTVRDALQE